MINNLNILFPEIFLSLSIFTILMIGVFKKSFNLILNLNFINYDFNLAIILNNFNQIMKKYF